MRLIYNRFRPHSSLDNLSPNEGYEKSKISSDSLLIALPKIWEGSILYASGEIALVMMGILLALQIENWDEQVKTRTELTEIFEEIHEGLPLNDQK